MTAKVDLVSPRIDAEGLAAALASQLDAEVRFDRGSRATYSTDASNYRQIPIGVVVPRTVEAVVGAVDICRRFDAPVLSRGAGTSLSGQTCNVAVVIDFSKYLNRILDVDPQRRIARVQPGVVLDDLRDVAEKHGLTFGPDPATHNRCTLGGMIGNNSCGVHSLMAGKTDENVLELSVLTYRGLRLRAHKNTEPDLPRLTERSESEGDVYRRLRDLRDRYADLISERFPNIPRRVSGYNLPHLLAQNGFDLAGALVGSEGTCVCVLEATLRLVSSPSARSLLVLGFGDIFTAADAVPAILEHRPIGLEGFDHRLIHDMRERSLHLADLDLLPEGSGWLLVEFGGEDRTETEQMAQRLIGDLSATGGQVSARLCRDRAEATKLWEVRESALGATAIVPGVLERWPGWDDSAVEPSRFGAYLRGLQGLMQRFGYDGAFYGHFGEGCLHVRYNFDLTSRAGIAKFAAFKQEAADLVVRFGGSLSGEHGDGQSHGQLLSKMFGVELVGAFREFKSVWDPDWRMNPGKVVDSGSPTADLRLGADYNPWTPKTHFAFREDGGSFAKAALRCVGVGKCRRHDTGTMCPSYMVTREEVHSTRGRARLLFEMLRGDTIGNGWRDESVRQALDLCLACKGCKGECPVNVDMATYKAEFLSHYYSRRLRPRTAYSMGLIHWWARAASLCPSLLNALAAAPVVSTLSKLGAGVALERQLPQLASATFKQQFRRQMMPPAASSKAVVLWADTFNNHFFPSTGMAAARVLRAAGFEVRVPSRPLCCGRPLYDYGMLDLARHLLRRVLKAMRAEIRAGVPVVVLEPSCAAVFRDEMANLLPDDEDARRLVGQTFLLAEFLVDHAPQLQWEPIGGHALLHGHCHQKALLGMDHDEALLRRLGLDVKVVDSGCCGMAGAFGFEREHYAVSIKCAERVLLPAIRNSSPETTIIADGFSCREQIRQLTGRNALHLAEVLAGALSGRV